MPSFVEAKVVENHIPALMARVESVSRAAVVKVAEEIASDARNLVPVDTGALQASIDVSSEVAGHEAVVTAGGGEVDYAGYVEYGTYKAPAQPYLGPAVDAHQHELLEDMTAAVEGF